MKKERLEWLKKPDNMTNLASTIYWYSKTKTKKTVLNLSSREQSEIAELFIENYLDGKLDLIPPVLQQVKWALTRQRDVDLINSHPTGYKLKSIYQFELRKLGADT